MYNPVLDSKDCIIISNHNAFTRLKCKTTLTNNNTPSFNWLITVNFNT